MRKTKNNKRLKLHNVIDELPEDKIDYVQGILDGIIISMQAEKESLKKAKTNIKNLLAMAGTLKLPKNFNAVK
jgi:hypothetical protein